MRALPVLCLLALAACEPQAPAKAPAEPPPPAQAAAPQGVVSDFSHDMDLTGTEPFWALKIRGTTFVLSRPDHPDVTATAPGASIRPGAAEWAAATADGAPMRVSLSVGACSDGMSDRSYPMTAEVAFGGETLRGCGDRAAAP